jgi:hypothetical protein
MFQQVWTYVTDRIMFQIECPQHFIVPKQTAIKMLNAIVAQVKVV